MEKEKNNHEEVAIHIDKQNPHSPNPTTGSALFILGNIDPAKYDLYREVHGNGDDEHIYNNDSAVELKNGDHFYGVQKSITPGV